MSETRDELREVARQALDEHNALLGDLLDLFDGPADEFETAWDRIRTRWVQPLRDLQQRGKKAA